MNIETFKADLVRYFAGDLDRIEERAFEAFLESSSQAQRLFDTAYDQHVENNGLKAMRSPRLHRRDCLSVATLQRYVDGTLSESDRALVQAHLSCPICLEDVQRLDGSAPPAPGRDKVDTPRAHRRPHRDRRRPRRWVSASILVAAGLCALVVVQPWRASEIEPTLSPYQATIAPVRRTARGGSPIAGPTTIAGDRTFTLTLTPDLPNRTPIETNILTVGERRKVTFDAVGTVTAQGVVRISRPARVMFPESGSWTVLAAVGRRGQVPRAAQLQIYADRTPNDAAAIDGSPAFTTPNWQLFVIALNVVDASPSPSP